MIDKVITAVVSGIVTGLVKHFWPAISGIARSWVRDTPDISGQWIASFTEPSPEGKPEKIDEKVALRQVGLFIWGQGTTMDKLNRSFVYQGRIIRGTIIGSYRRKGSKRPAGTGSFQLQISANDRRMNGRCIWLDADTDCVESSEYVWEKTE